MINHSAEQDDTKYPVVTGVPEGYYVPVYKDLEEQHAGLVLLRFLNINDERGNDTPSNLIDTLKHIIPTMLKLSLNSGL